MTSRNCRCGCGGPGVFLVDLTDLDGKRYVDEPACAAAERYLAGCAAELGRPFASRRVAVGRGRRGPVVK